MWREACVRMKKCIWNEAEAGIPILENYFQNEEDKRKRQEQERQKQASRLRKEERQKAEREREGGEEIRG